MIIHMKNKFHMFIKSRSIHFINELYYNHNCQNGKERKKQTSDLEGNPFYSLPFPMPQCADGDDKMAALTSHRKRLRFELGTVERAMAEHPAFEDVTMNARATVLYQR